MACWIFFKLALLPVPLWKQWNYLELSCKKAGIIFFGWKTLFVQSLYTLSTLFCSILIFLYASWQNWLVGKWQAHGGVYPKFIFLLSLSSLFLKLGSKICPLWSLTWWQKWLLFHWMVALFSTTVFSGQTQGTQASWAFLVLSISAKSPGGRAPTKSVSDRQPGRRPCPWKDNHCLQSATVLEPIPLSWSSVLLFAAELWRNPWEWPEPEMDISEINSLLLGRKALVGHANCLRQKGLPALLEFVTEER